MRFVIRRTRKSSLLSRVETQWENPKKGEEPKIISYYSSVQGEPLVRRNSVESYPDLKIRRKIVFGCPDLEIRRRQCLFVRIVYSRKKIVCVTAVYNIRKTFREKWSSDQCIYKFILIYGLFMNWDYWSYCIFKIVSISSH